MWTSKLGNKYPIDEIERNHKDTIAKLTKLRHEGANKFCAECGNPGTVWSSVNLGVFTCMRCGSLHRALGTHVSKPKGCHGSYLWGPDEMERMREIGNERAATLYGGLEHRPRENASDSEWLRYLQNKYEHRTWAVKQKIVREPEQENDTVFQSKTIPASSSSAMNNIPDKYGAAMDDFAQISMFSNAKKPTKDLFGKNKQPQLKKSTAVSPPDLLDDESHSADMPTVTNPPALPPSVDFFAEFGLRLIRTSATPPFAPSCRIRYRRPRKSDQHPKVVYWRI